jgi:hypothetical protein
MMSAPAFENERQMQSVLSGFHRFLSTCVKTTEGNAEAPDILLMCSTVQHKPALKYFGQSKVEDDATRVAKAHVQKRVLFKEADGTETWPAKVPISEQKISTNQQTEETKGSIYLPIIPIYGQRTIATQHPEVTGDSMMRHSVQLHIDVLSQFHTHPHDITGGADLTPKSTLNDMYLTYNNSSTGGKTLPKLKSHASKMIPGLDLPVTPEINGGIELGTSDTSPTDLMSTYCTYNSFSDELDNCDTTPRPDHLLAYAF